MQEYMEIGQIINTHGIKGELKIRPTTFDISRFELLDKIFVNKGSKLVEYSIEGVRYFKEYILLKLETIDDISVAEKLKTFTLEIPRDLALPLKDNEYYIGDLYNMQVITDKGEELGILSDILTTGSNDVYVIKDMNNPKGKELLIPAIKECILDIDLDKNLMTVHLLEGLRDL